MEYINILGFGHAALFIKDMTESKEFYNQILNFKVVSEYTREDGTQLCFMSKGNCTVELIEFSDKGISLNRTDGIIDHISIKVDDVETAKAYLESKGVLFDNEIQFDENLFEKGQKYAHFRGPSGERLQIEQNL